MHASYLRMSVDKGGVVIADDTGTEEIALTDLAIPQVLCERLLDWGSRYEVVVHWTQERRRVEIGRLREFDAEGLSLREELVVTLGGQAKIRYYSEALLRDIDSLDDFDFWASHL
jgi:hypothetical protein